MCSHGLSLVASVCNRGLVLDEGTISYDGPIGKAIEHYEQITEDSINWIEFEYSEKAVSKSGLRFDFKKEFNVQERIRLVIHDNKLKEFILIEELETGEDFRIDRKDLPEHLDCIFKVQQYRDGKWFDSSRYVKLVEKNELGTWVIVNQLAESYWWLGLDLIS